MKVIVKAVAGSHLFGLNTPESDKDYKGVYIPSKREILLGEYPKSISQSTGDDHSKNTSEDQDVELYSLPKFFKMLRNGDTAALELLFTPDEFVVETSPEWEEIRSLREQLVSKKVTAMIGYARQQAAKYGIKGSRMGELKKVIDTLTESEYHLYDGAAKLRCDWKHFRDNFKDLKHVHEIELETKNGTTELKTPAFDILGKKFSHHDKISHVLNILNKMYDNYGKRAEQAKNNDGIDWKALSHAMRVIYQGEELLQRGLITLPHVKQDREYLLKIKNGELGFDDVSKELEYQLENLEKFKEDSELPEEISKDFTDDLIVKFFNEVVK